MALFLILSHSEQLRSEERPIASILTKETADEWSNSNKEGWTQTSVKE